MKYTLIMLMVNVIIKFNYLSGCHALLLQCSPPLLSFPTTFDYVVIGKSIKR